MKPEDSTCMTMSHFPYGLPGAKNMNTLTEDKEIENHLTPEVKH